MHMCNRLLLGSLLGSLGGSALLLLAFVAALGAGFAESAESRSLLLLRGDGTGCLGLVDDGKSGERAGNVGSEVLALFIS